MNSNLCSTARIARARRFVGESTDAGKNTLSRVST